MTIPSIPSHNTTTYKCVSRCTTPQTSTTRTRTHLTLLILASQDLLLLMMDYSRSSLVNISPYFCQGKNVKELGQSWLCTSVELESLKVQAQEEIMRRDEQLSQVKELLYKAMVERDDALQKCQSLQFERQSLLLLQQQVKDVKNATPTADPLSGLPSIEDELPIRHTNTKTTTNNNLTSSDSDDQRIVSSPRTDPTPNQFQHQPNVTKTISKLQSFHEEVMQRLLPLPHSTTESKYQLPEKGKLLEAVMNAGPLLQTLLLAGPLPQWRHPLPPLESFEIPPVTININSNRCISRKRSLLSLTTHCLDSSTDLHRHQSHKFQKPHNNTLLQQ